MKRRRTTRLSVNLTAVRTDAASSGHHLSEFHSDFLVVAVDHGKIEPIHRLGSRRRSPRSSIVDNLKIEPVCSRLKPRRGMSCGTAWQCQGRADSGEASGDRCCTDLAS